MNGVSGYFKMKSACTNGPGESTYFQTAFYHCRFIITGGGFENRKIQSLRTGEEEFDKIKYKKEG